MVEGARMKCRVEEESAYWWVVRKGLSEEVEVMTREV